MARGVIPPAPWETNQEDSVPPPPWEFPDILSSVFEKYPKLKNGNDPAKTQVIFSSPERTKQAGKNLLEYWPADEPGRPDFPHPSPGKTTLEIYDKKLQSDPKALEIAVVGDLLHGMRNDPKYEAMRQEFARNFTPQAVAMDKKQGMQMNDSRLDEFIRGYVADDPNDEFVRSYKSGEAIYSKKQVELLDKMKSYISENADIPPAPWESKAEVPPAPWEEKNKPGLMDTFTAAVKTVVPTIYKGALDAKIPFEKTLVQAEQAGASLAGTTHEELIKKHPNLYGIPSGLAEGAAKLLEGVYNVRSLGLVAATMAIPSKLIQFAAGSGFSAMMAKDALDKWTAGIKAYHQGDNHGAAKNFTESIGTGIFSAAGMAGALHGEEGPVTRTQTPEEAAIHTDQMLEKPPIGPERQLKAPIPPGEPGSVVYGNPPPIIPPSRQLTGPPQLDSETIRLLERMTGKPIDQIRKEFVKTELEKAGGQLVEPPVERLKTEKKPKEYDPIQDIYSMGGLSTTDPDTLELKNMDIPFGIFRKGGKSLDTIRESWAEQGRIPKDASLNDVRNIISEGLAARKGGGAAAERSATGMLDPEEMDRKINQEAGRVGNMSDADLGTEQSKWTSLLAQKGNLYARERARLAEVTDELNVRRQRTRDQTIQEGKIDRSGQPDDSGSADFNFGENINKSGLPTAYDILGAEGNVGKTFQFPKDSRVEEFRTKQHRGERIYGDPEIEGEVKREYISKDLGLWKKSFVETVKRGSDGKPLKDTPIIHIDFDNLRDLNSAVGHVHADQMFKTFAQKLNEYGFTAARVGGDEFVIILNPVKRGAANPLQVFERFKQFQNDMANAEIFDMDTGEVVHKGLSMSAGFGKDLVSADRMAIRAKNEGKGKILLDKKFLEAYNQSEGTNYEWKTPNSDILEGRATKALPGQVPEASARSENRQKDLQPPQSEQPQSKTPLNKFQPQSEGERLPSEAGSTLLLTEVAGRITDIAKKAKDYQEFRRKIAEDVDLQDTARFYSMNLRQTYEDAKKEGSPPGAPPGTQEKSTTGWTGPGKPKIRMPGLATLEVDVQRTADKLDAMLGQAENIANTGTIQPKDARADFAFGLPSDKNVTNVKVAETIKKFFVDSVVEVERLKNVAERSADDLTVAQLEAAQKRLEIASSAFLEQRSIWGRVGHVYQRGIQEDLMQAAIKDGRDATAYLKTVKNIKPKLAVLDRVVLATMRMINPEAAAKFAKGEKMAGFEMGNAPGSIPENLRVPRAIYDAFRLNLFTFGSPIRDSYDNASAVATETAGYLGQDLYSSLKGENPRRIASIIKSLREQVPAFARKPLGMNEQKILPDSIEQALGNDIRDVSGKDSGIMTNIKFGRIPLDAPLSPAVKLKRVADVLPSRIFAMADLMSSAAKAADSQALNGLARQTFINNFLKNPPETAVKSAVEIGKKIKFQVDLSKTEKWVSNNVVYQLLGDAFPSWAFQYSRWAGRTLGADPAMWKKIKSGEAGGAEITGYLTKAAAGWGGIYLVNNIIYPHVDFNSMEYVDDRGRRTRLSGTSAIPMALFAAAVFKGDMHKAALALKYAPIPGAKLIPGSQAGLLSNWLESVSAYLKGGISDERFKSEVNNIVNNLVPGRAVLSMLKTMADPVLRQGIGAEIPFYSKTRPPVINPGTGKPLAPRQEGLGMELPAAGGTAIPGFRRVQTPLEREMQLHGIGLFRDRRTPIAEFQTDEIPSELRQEFKAIAGEFLNRVGTGLIQNQDYQKLSRARTKESFDAQTKVLEKIFQAAQDYSVAVIEAQRGVKIKQKVTPFKTMGLPEKYAGKRKRVEKVGASSGDELPQ